MNESERESEARHDRELAEARILRDHVEELKKNRVWQHLVETLNAEIEERRRHYEQAVGRTIEELVKNEASRGALATARSVLEFPENVKSASENLIEMLTKKGQSSEPNDE